MHIKKFCLSTATILLISIFVLTPCQNITYAYDKPLLKDADRLWEEQSYTMSLPKYRTLLKDENISDQLKNEIHFKLADSLWRSQSNQINKESEKILKELILSKEHNRWWAEANESLAEHYLKADRWQHQNEIIEFLNNARDYWAGTTDIKLARERFIRASFTLGDYLSTDWGWYYSGIVPTRYSDTPVPIQPGTENYGLDVLYQEILKVAKNDNDKAKAYYSIAMSLMNRSYQEEDRKRVVKHFTKVIEDYRDSEWLDDSYYYLGQIYEQKNDFIKAVEVYRSLLENFKKGQSQWVNNAQNQIKNITSPEINISTGYTYLPDSQIQFNLGWRNIEKANFTIYKLDLIKILQLDTSKKETDYNRGIDNYQRMMANLVKSNRYQTLSTVRSWTRVLKNEKKHGWHNGSQGLAEWQVPEEHKDEIDPKSGILPPGAYLLLVSAGKKKAYELILVTDLGLAAKVAGRSALFFTFDSLTGKPNPNIKVKYQYRYYDDNNHWLWEEGSGTTDDEGLLKVPLKNNNNQYSNNQHNVFVTASDNTMQAFSQGNYYGGNTGKGNWWLYAYSDRPAYRPNETVSIKGILRNYDGSDFTNPQGKQVKARIYDPRGNIVKEQTHTLNSYGSFVDTFVLDEKAPLGQYRIDILDVHKNNRLANANLFRLEEYKLPEFLVNIKPRAKDEQEGSSTYRLGDTIEVELDAQYYFGGAVAHAEVEYLVYQNNYTHSYYPKKEYAWYYEDMRPNYYSYGHGQLIKQEKIKTDEEGKAVFSFETPKDVNADLKYHIEARVVDKSRREIKASSDIKVTKNSFYAYLTPKQNLYRPGDKSLVDIKTLTANEEAIAVDGKVTVYRNWWRTKSAPVKVDADEAMARRIMPPHGEYGENELFTKFIKTDEKGEAAFTFEPDSNGYYTVKFTGYDTDGSEVISSTVVYVCATQSEDIGFRFSGLQIITEKNTYAIGETAQVMLVSDTPDTWVLFSSEADEIFDHQLIHLTGSVKRVEIPIKDIYSPNVFFDTVSAQNYQLKRNQIQVIVPPDDNFLNITITSDKETYAPQEEGHFEIEVADNQGNPVSGELSLGVVDKSVYYIQPDYAQDIRQFFYGNKRNHSVQTNASFYQKQYKRLVRSEDNQLLTKEQQFTQNLRRNIDGKDFNDLDEVYGGRLKGATDDISGQFSVGNSSGLSYEPYYLETDYEIARTEEQEVRSPSLAASKVLSKKEGKMKIMDGSVGQLDTPDVRTDFRSTVLWQPTIITDESGKAHITAKYPDSLTTWTTTARVITHQTHVGNITHEVKTKKDVIVRLQAPRFFTERDKVTISANVHNYTDKEQKIKVTIDANGLKVLDDKSVWVKIPSHGEERVDWTCLVPQKGTADITVMAQAKTSSDAMKKTYPIIPHGIEKFIASAIVLKNDGEQSLSKEFTINIPKERIKESTTLEINLSPSIAASLLDALPYLADYPYGCVEQTMSRFLPSIIVAKTIEDLGLTEAQVRSYIQDVLVPRNDPEGHPKRRQDLTVTKLDRITEDSLKRLYDFQHTDGGWGWWKEDDSDRFMSAYVVWGLSLAHDAGMKIKPKVLSRGIQFLQQELVEEEDNPDMLAWMLHALSSARSNSAFEQKQSARLWNKRNDLNPYTRALFALSEFNRNNSERAATLARNLANGIEEDNENQTAHWGKGGVHYRWSEGGVEATAFGIKALSNIDPSSAYLEPAVKWIALNRRGSRWKNTRDTAIAILGLTDYLKATNELNPDYNYEVSVNKKVVKSGKVNASNIFTFAHRITLPDNALKDGKNDVTITINGRGSLYVSGYLKYFTLEEDITAAGNEVFVKRRYFKEKTKETLLKGYVSDWTELKSGDKLKSGERVKVEIILETKNHYEYLVVEDYKPAGFEAVALKSGTGYAKTLDDDGLESNSSVWLYKEFRDKKVAFFITKLPQGKHKITYELRAEVPGEFHGMPNQTHAMYVPEIRANSNEMRLNIVD